jgi:LysM repeat protein
MPEITLSLPAALGLLALFLSIGAVLVYAAMHQASPILDPTITPTTTLTVTPTTSPTPATPTVTNTPMPSPTPQVYTVQLGDSCGAIAYRFGVSINSIVLLNSLPAACDTLFEGQKLFIPVPTPTSTPLPSATLGPEEATRAACPKVQYTVQENDTLGGIAANYQVPKEAISDYNGLVNDVVQFGQQLVIPLCMRASTPGPTPTPTLPPPYPAPNLLLPADGAAFTLADETVTLQWASVGTLRENEAYAVTVEDITGAGGQKNVSYVTDTKYIVPRSMRPNDNKPHLMRWSVVSVRQTGTDDEGNPIWEAAGAPSVSRGFVWTGFASPTTPTP